MKQVVVSFVAAAAVAGVIAVTAQDSGQATSEAAPISGVTLPPGYRDWKLISVARVGANQNDLRAKLGNDIALKAFRAGKLPFPDGTIIARLAWRAVTSEENNAALRPLLEKQLDKAVVEGLMAESFVAGPPTNVQI